MNVNERLQNKIDNLEKEMMKEKGMKGEDEEEIQVIDQEEEEIEKVEVTPPVVEKVEEVKVENEKTVPSPDNRF